MDVKKSIRLRIGIGFEWMEVATERNIKVDDNSSEDQVKSISESLFERVKEETVKDAVGVFKSLNIPCEKGIFLNAYNELSSAKSGETVRVNVLSQDAQEAACKLQQNQQPQEAIQPIPSPVIDTSPVACELEELYQFTEFK